MQNETALALIPLLPLAGFVINGLAGKRLGKHAVSVIACAGPIASFFLSVKLFMYLLYSGMDVPVVEATLYTWIAAGGLTIDMSFVCDQLASIMLLVVTGVGSLIHVYSTEYMEGEDAGGYARYFAFLNLFAGMMLVLVSASSMPLMFIGWEGVGCCSYLLIGFWYKDTANADAGRKAFIVNRIGDFGFLLGIFLIWTLVGSLEFADITAKAKEVLAGNAELAVGGVALACLLLLLGATGKSAQIPLYVWLPDAMAGPTPVSALIHAATMVTAGVYMVARLGFFFSLVPGVLLVVATIGVLTAFLAATMAMTEYDLKKVLAYSTISQLGYMFVGVGTGVFASGIFHLMTHAFFKALLFLGAGAVMHAFHHMDMRRFGGLKQKMPWSYWLFLIGALSLAGIPPFSGFFSKDEILASAFAHFLEHHSIGWLLIWFLGFITAMLTAFYTFRAVSMTFFQKFRGTEHEWEHAHDPGLAILVPLGVLGILAGLGGFVNIPPIFGGHSVLFGYMAPSVGAVAHGEHMGGLWFAAVITTLGACGSAYASYWLYTKRPELLEALLDKLRMRRLQAASQAKYRVDETYAALVVKPVFESAYALWKWVDVAIIDNAVNRTGQAATAIASFVRRTQSGYLGQYVFYVAGGAVAVLLILMIG